MKSKNVKKNVPVITNSESIFTAVSLVINKKQKFIEALERAGVKDAKVLMPDVKDNQVEEIIKAGISFLFARKNTITGIGKVITTKQFTKNRAKNRATVARFKPTEPKAKILKPVITNIKPTTMGKKLNVTGALVGAMRDKPNLFEKGFRVNDILAEIAGRLNRTVTDPKGVVKLGRSFSPTLSYLRRNKVIQLGKSKGEWLLEDKWE